MVTQPNFVAERGDEYRAEVPVAQHHQLWRVASLADAGIPVALSTDTPFGDGDPWAAMRSAVHRDTPAGAVLGAGEAVSPRAAVQMFLGWPDRPAVARRVAPGQPGDLCVLAGPPDQVLAELDAGLVAATIIGGAIVRLSQCGRSRNGTSRYGSGSLGRPSTRSPTMLRWIWSVPPPIDVK